MSALDPRDPRVELVTAPAGSGKTTLLVQHFLRHLREGVPIERIVAITFTRKAAAELVERVSRNLDRVRRGEALKAHYAPFAPSVDQARAALARMDAAPAGTVDSFVHAVLEQHLLDAFLPLSDGGRAWIDGPLEPGVGSTPHYEAAAREVLEALDADARVVLAETSLGRAIADVALLAAAAPTEARSSLSLLDVLAARVGPVLRADARCAVDVRDAPVNKAGRAVHDQVLPWLEDPDLDVPPALLTWLFDIKGSKPFVDLREARDQAVIQVLDAELDIPAAKVTRPDRVLPRLRVEGDWSAREALVRADAFRGALLRLVDRARDRACRDMASAGQLGYAELLAAATALCQFAPASLAGRFDVLMVDEVQDTNPAQLRFYRAFWGMKRAEKPPIKGFFVGDTRQSIYRFRQADPFGWMDLVDETRARGTWAELPVNYRSSELLVQSHAAVFHGLLDEKETGVERMDSLVATAENAGTGLLVDCDWPEPVAVFDGDTAADHEARALAAFAHRLQQRWEAHPHETGAVIVRSWSRGVWAIRQLTALGLHAQLTGDRALLQSRVCRDLRQFLAAMLDITDDLALAGALRHPSVGITDRALLQLRASGPLARLFADPDALAGDLDAADREALDRGLAALVAQRRRLGREPTAEVLEQLVARLHWRPIIAASPEGDVGVAQLEILLDLVRELEADRVDPEAALQLLRTDPRQSTDLPVVRMHRGSEVVQVCTYFGAKGLEFDHVALMQVGGGGSDGAEGEVGGSVALYRPRGRTVVGVNLDPRGGLTASKDPVGAAAAAFSSWESREEALRLFYVGYTRARSSVTFGLEQTRKTGKGLDTSIRKVFVHEGGTASHGAVRVLTADDVDSPEVTWQVRQFTGRTRPFEAAWRGEGAVDGWSVERPSSFARSLGDDVVPLREYLMARARLVAPEQPTAIAIPAALDGVREIVRGDVVHGWLEAWGLRGDPDEALAAAYLQQRWGSDAEDVAAWLVAVGLQMRDELPGFTDLLTGELHFEWPVVGVDDSRLIAGRADLVVQWPGRELTVIDFKAGSAVAHVKDGNPVIPHFSDYGPQLEAYRRCFSAAGYTVREVGLIYVRGPAWVRIDV